jgi:hypothetical protein
MANLIRPGTAQPDASAVQDVAPLYSPRHRPLPRPLWRRILHPVTAICAVQTALSLTLVWSNTAFTDEAEYLWAGHLEISHWLHGTPLPSIFSHNFSGSPYIYPPIGAMADAVGGLAAARILSLIFMLGATALLYLVAKRLFGNAAALIASALWAISEPAMRLGAFATYDALSIFLTALSAWLAVQAGYRRHRGELVAASAAVLALANATAYYGIVIDPVVIVFVFLAWLSAIGAKQARICAAWLSGTYLAFFVLIMTESHSWAGIIHTTGFVAHNDAVALILNSIWAYSGSCMVLAAIGATTAIFAEKGSKRILIVLLGCAALVVPVAQIVDHTEVSLDQHLPYGLWFAAMAAGYGCSKLVQSLPTSRRIPAILCCGLALAYPAADNWQAAWYKQLSWSNSSSFVSAFKPVAGQAHGLIYASTQGYVAMYYIPQGHDWTRWNRSELSRSELPLDPSGIPQNSWIAFYSKLLRKIGYGAIALFYTTTVRGLPGEMVLPSQNNIARGQLLNIVASDTGSASRPMRGLPALTLAVENDSAYRLVTVGPYSTNTINGIYAIWQKKAQT